MKNNFYNKNLKDYANQNRKSMTKAEASLWKYALKSSQLEGITFNRQNQLESTLLISIQKN